VKASRLIAGLVVVAIVAGALFAALSLVNDDDPVVGGGGGDSPSLAPTPTPEEGSSEPPSADLAEFYSQQLTWTSCRGDFECATLTVPVDYEDPAGDTIDLAVLKDPADSPADRVGSLVVNPGGPG